MRFCDWVTYGLLGIFLCLSIAAKAQSAKDYYKIATNYAKEGNPAEAIKRYTKAIDLNTDYERAYAGRAEAYADIGEQELSAADWFRAGELSGRDANHFVRAADHYLAVDNLQRCSEALEAALVIDDKHMEAWQIKTRLHLAQHEFVKAHQSASAALDQKRNLINTFWMAVVSDSLGVYDEAARYFEEILENNHLYAEAHEGLVAVRTKNHLRLNASYRKTEELHKALDRCNTALEIFPDNNRLYVLRSQIHFLNHDFVDAISDISKAIAAQPDDTALHLQRGKYYRAFGQQHNALNDFNAVIRIRPEDAGAQYQRGLALEATFAYNEALTAFEEALRLAKASGKGNADLFREARNRILELNREDQAPLIAMQHPLVDKSDGILLRRDQDSIDVNGVIRDQSRIKVIKVNGVNARFNRNVVNPEFSCRLSSKALDNITISTTDWYDNAASASYAVTYTEIDPPHIALSKPYASDNQTVTVEAGTTKLSLEGRVTDESLLTSILIDGVAASYPVDQRNPSFIALIHIGNKDRFSIVAKDFYGNESAVEYTILREERTIAADNPMGKTWAVFIENTEYSNFASIDGPAKDVDAMQKAFSYYDIHRIIHKKNLTKEQFDRFFSIELRDLVRREKVNSILVWYAGHGKFINDSGYWIPVDADRSDEFTYFKINNLKASLESYSDLLTHTLVISDACESGPSFYEAMRGNGEEKTCDNWDYTAFKSRQVLTSSGYELAMDQSKFTEAFSQALLVNDNTCIPIDQVYQQVQTEVKKNNQVARFGKIPGLGDENGTFFFIRKEQ